MTIMEPRISKDAISRAINGEGPIAAAFCGVVGKIAAIILAWLAIVGLMAWLFPNI